jgi:hypothetical protein
MKIAKILRSRKFWALVAALIGVASGFYSGGVDAFQSLQLAIGAVSAYVIGTGIEAAGEARG